MIHSALRIPHSALLLAATALLALAFSSRADEIRIATWNVHEGLSAAAVQARGDDLRGAAAAIRPDVLLVEEITSLAALEAVRDAMGLKGFHCACSDFNPADQPDFACLEVGIISRFPFDQVIEYDTTPDNVGKPGAPDEVMLNPSLKLGIARPKDEIRGFLWARIDQLKLTVAVVHLKSSRGLGGAEDRSNADKRELVAAAVAASVVEDRWRWPEYSCIVGGDFNVGHADVAKNGTRLDEDNDQASPGHDGYDDTHALFRGGLVGGLKMHNLLGHTIEPTFPSFPSSPIDNLYVTGPGEKNFSPATIIAETFGSDHRPVVTVYQTPVFPATPKPSKPPETKTAKTTSPETPTAIPSAEARKHLDRDGTVEMRVAESTLLTDRRICFLNSLADRSKPENFTAVIFADGLRSLSAAGIEDPAAYFRGKTIRVSGHIHLRKDACQIVVDKASQISVVGEESKR